VEKIKQLADAMRKKLGDSLQEIEGTEIRLAGTIE
jgi:hypothetical protein